MDYFNLKAKNTTLRQEILAGITTFTTMSYILIVNPNILSQAGMNPIGVLVATVVGSIIATLIMAFYAKLPFALAPGLGMNAFFVYFVVGTMGFSWQAGMLATYLAGLTMVLLLWFGFYEKLTSAIPDNLKYSIIVGIGFAILLLGIKYANIIEVTGGSFTIKGIYSIQSVIATIALIVMVVLSARKFVGAILIGILLAYALGIMAQLSGLYVVNDLNASLIPQFSMQEGYFEGFMQVAFQFSSFGEVFSDFFRGLSFVFMVILMASTHFLDAVGTLFGLSAQMSDSDKTASTEVIKRAMYADSIGAVIGACLGTTTLTTYAENSVGVASGGRTGITAITIASCFAVSLLIAPVFTAIPNFAIAPALIIAGVVLMRNIRRIDFGHYENAIPATVVIIMVGMSFDIFNAYLYGITIQMIIKLLTGKAKEINRVSYLFFILLLMNLFLQLGG